MAYKAERWPHVDAMIQANRDSAAHRGNRTRRPIGEPWMTRRQAVNAFKYHGGQHMVAYRLAGSIYWECAWENGLNYVTVMACRQTWDGKPVEETIWYDPNEQQAERGSDGEG